MLSEQATNNRAGCSVRLLRPLSMWIVTAEDSIRVRPSAVVVGSLNRTNRDLGAERGNDAVAEQRDAHAGAELDVAVAGLQAEALDRGVERQEAAEDVVSDGNATEQAANHRDDAVDNRQAGGAEQVTHEGQAGEAEVGQEGALDTDDRVERASGIILLRSTATLADDFRMSILRSDLPEPRRFGRMSMAPPSETACEM